MVLIRVTDTPREEFLPWKDSTSCAEAREFFAPIICHDNIAPRVGEVAFVARDYAFSLSFFLGGGKCFFWSSISRRRHDRHDTSSGHGVIQRDPAFRGTP